MALGEPCRTETERLMRDMGLAGGRTPALCWTPLEQALHDGRPVHRGGLIHHSDRGSQYVSIKYTERLAEAGIEPSVGSVGASMLDDAPHHLRVSLMTMLWPMP
jgi:transposase InsO family protein